MFSTMPPAQIESFGRRSSAPSVGALPAEEIRDAGRIDRILRALARLRAKGRVIDATGTAVGFLTAVSRGGRTGSLRRWDYDGPPLQASLVVEIGGPLSLYRFELDVAHANDGQVDTEAPSVVERIRTRREARERPPPNTVVRFRSVGDRPVVWRVENVSRRGLSLAPAASCAGLRAGDVISNVVVEWGGRLRIQMDLHVRHVSEQFGDGRRVAGAEIDFASPDDAYHWEREVESLGDVTTRTGGSWTRDLWELYEQSGYFALSSKTPAEFDHLRDAFEIASRKLARAPSLGLQIVWPSIRGAEASVSLVALNHHAVFLYHVARRHGNPPVGATGRTILHDIYCRAIGWIGASDFAKWLVVWVQDVTDFSKRLHLDFVKRHADSARAGVTAFRALEIPTEAVAQAAAAQGAGGRAAEWNVRAASADDVAEITRALAATFPPSIMDALGLTVPFERRWSAWDDSSLLRGRDIVVAERDGRIDAVAVLECAEDGIHLFGLLDVVRVVTMRDSPGATEALLAHAGDMFQQIGKRVFIFACDPALPEDQWPDGAVDLGITHCTVMSTALLPQFADHAWELTMGWPE
jgi:hypothetical protein